MSNLKKRKKMKKYILSLGLIAIAFCLTNCAPSNNDFNIPTEPAQEFALCAAVSRTTNDGLNTLWKDGDNLSVFHAVAGTTEFVKDKEFVLADATTGYFKGALADNATLTEEAYDWYVIYPYHSALNRPGYGSYYNIGNTKNAGKQTQNGNNSTHHLSGNYLPLVGVAKDVATDKMPALELKNAASYAKFIVTNKLDEAIVVTEISMSAPGHHLTGGFYIHFADMENIAYNPASNSTSDTATLQVASGKEIAAGESANFYVAVAPFTVPTGENITFSVKAKNAQNAEAECVIEHTTTKDFVFRAGKYKEISFPYRATFESVVLPSVSTEEAPYIVGFENSEGFETTTTYKYADVRYTGEDNKQWGTVYGTPSATGKISGAQSMHMRIYNVNGVWSDSYTYTNFTLSHVKEVRFEATSENNNNIKLSYRTAGKNWVDLETYTLSSTAKAYKYEFESVVESAQFKFTIVNDNPTDGKRVIIDNVTFSANEILASANATTKEATNTESADGTTATLNGAYDIINGSGEEAITCGFEYKSADSYTSVTAENATEFTYNLTGLTVDTEYTYRAWVSLDGGTTKSYGEEMTFTTTKASTILKSISLTTTDIENIGIKYGYTDSDIKSISASDGSVWTAYHAYRTASSSTIGVKKETPDGYLATPVVSGTITKIVINIKSTGANTKFTLAHRDNDVFYTSNALGKTTKDWSVDITNDCSQIFIHSAYGTVTINSVTIYYE